MESEFQIWSDGPGRLQAIVARRTPFEAHSALNQFAEWATFKAESCNGRLMMIRPSGGQILNAGNQQGILVNFQSNEWSRLNGHKGHRQKKVSEMGHTSAKSTADWTEKAMKLRCFNAKIGFFIDCDSSFPNELISSAIGKERRKYLIIKF